MSKSPCYKNGVACTKRHVGCHGECEEYQAFSESCAQRRDARLKDNIYRNYICDLVEKRRRR